ncbi:MAG: LCP family protein [Eubacterium sp.]|nr:LCP family protein [Eubacterium sp.]
MLKKRLFYIFFALNIIATFTLLGFVVLTKIVPTLYVTLLLILFLIIPVVLLILQKVLKHHRQRSRVRVIGIILLILGIIIDIVLIYYVYITNRTIGEVTSANTQSEIIQVYVAKDDPAENINDALSREYRFGILKVGDREVVNELINKIESNSTVKMDIIEYPSIIDLVSAMKSSKIDSFILSDAYMEALSSMEGYAKYNESVRAIYSTSVESEIKVVKKNETKEVEESSFDYLSECFSIYISGIDTYGPVTTKSRSDVNIIATVNLKTHNVLLVSTPRDFYVPFGIFDGAKDKLTHAGVYGIDTSMDVLGDLYGIDLNYYMRVNFTGFTSIIDKLGGVDVVSDARFSAGGYVFVEGSNHLTGAEALAFSRERYSFADGDRARGRHQMAVIKAVINGMASTTILTNYSSIMAELSGTFQTNMTQDEIGEIVKDQISTQKGWNVVTYSVDGSGTTAMSAAMGVNAYMMVPYDDTVEYAKELMTKVKDGYTLNQSTVEDNAPKH